VKNGATSRAGYSSRWSRLGVAVAATLFGLLAAEGVTRICLRATPPPADAPYAADPDFDYKLRPGPFWEDGRDPSDSVNTFGFRDREWTAQKLPHTYRVLTIGDSFVFGTAPRGENFPEVAEARLDSAMAGTVARIDLLRAGLGGFSPEHYVGVLRSLLPRVDADGLVLCLYVGNDITSIAVRGRVLRGELYYQGSASPARALLRRSEMFLVLEKAFLARGGERAAALLVGRGGGGSREEGDVPKAGGSARSTESAASSAHTMELAASYLLTTRGQLPVFARTPDARTARAWRRVEACLQTFDDLCREADTPWRLVLIPSELQIDRDVRQRVLAALGRGDNDRDPAFDWDAPQRRLKAWAAAQGVPTLDLLPVLRARPERLYLVNDTHFNRVGHRVAGETLAEWLASDSLAPSATLPNP